MLFTDPVFLTKFLPLVLLGFFATLFSKTRWHSQILLIGASLVFYSWFKSEYLVLLVGSMGVNYILAKYILAQPGTSKSKQILVIGIVANLLLLGVYKYLGFLTVNFNALFDVGLPDPKLLLPLAISFFTFQQISYLCDSHAGKMDPASHTPLEYALFVTFFPQLIAGPIVHHAEMMPQFRKIITPSARAIMFCEGLCLFALGLFKKLAIADSIAPYANQVFTSVDSGVAVTSVTAWGGALAYTFQIYFDFSGYSDMAIGLGLLFAIRLPWNFNSPYKSENMSEFWRRWHMTLSRWLRDYLYIPLGGNRHGKVRQYINNFTTMVLGGLWHGAHWNFIIWGALHGFYLIVNQLVRAIARTFGVLEIVETAKAIRISSWAITFLAAVVAWVFFRATTTSGAITMTLSMFGSVADGAVHMPATLQTILWGTLAAISAFLLPNTKEISELFEKDLLKRSSALISALGITSGVAASAAFLASLSLTQSPFLYFNF